MNKSNDTKIKTLLQRVEEKKEELGRKPRARWNTTGVFKCPENDFNLNTIQDPKILVDAFSYLLREKSYREEAAQLLGVEVSPFKWDRFTLEEWQEDFRLRINILAYNKRKRELAELQAKLTKLISEETKTEMELENIESLLGE